MRISTRQGIMTFWLLSAAAAAGCADLDIHGPDWGPDWDFPDHRNTDFSAQISFFLHLESAEALSLTGTAGSVEVVGSAAATSISVEGMRRVRSDSEADAQQHLPNLQVNAWEAGGTVFIETDQPERNWGRRYEVDYRITVPTGTNVTVQHVAGPVAVRSATGTVDVQSVAGKVTVEGTEGDVRVTATTGEIEASSTLAPGGTVELAISAGQISLVIPGSTSAALVATTGVGLVSLVNLDLTDEDPRPSVVRGTMADGNGAIDLRSGAGNITVRGDG